MVRGPFGASLTVATRCGDPAVDDAPYSGGVGAERNFSLSSDPRIRPKKNWWGGGVENFLHTKHLSENIFLTKGICTRTPRPNMVGGYMKRADWSRIEKNLQCATVVIKLL